MTPLKNLYFLARTLLRHPRMLRVHPALNLFFLRYISKFRIKNSAGHWTVHSHLPPLNSRAYRPLHRRAPAGTRQRPSHAQIGLTNACPQRCAYCYNRERNGQAHGHGDDPRTVVRELAGAWASSGSG